MIKVINKLPPVTNNKTFIKKGKTYSYKGKPPVMGLYFWRNSKDEIIYIGTSTNIRKKFDRYRNRWDQNKWASTRPIFKFLLEREENVSFDWVEYKDFDLMNDHEEQFIKHYSPILNMTSDGKGGRSFKTTQERRKEYGN